MDTEPGRRKTFEDFYAGLSPEERRGRIFLKPEFRDAYNELVEADRQFPVPTYLWEKWVPELGVFPVAVYLELRRMCFVNRATGERRDWCWPRQETLAKRLGVKKRQTVGEALRTLEEHGFISREKSYRKRGGDALMQRGSDRYLVYFEIPLVPTDAVELLLRRLAPEDRDGGAAAPTPVTVFVPVAMPESDMSAKRTYRDEAVDNSADRSEKRTYTAVRKTDSRTITRITNNVTNVDLTSYKETKSLGKLRLNPAVAQMDLAEKNRREQLAHEIGESLGRMAGGRELGLHPSLGFHRRAAFLMPENLIREALMATRDAVERRRSGDGGLRSDPGAFFAGTVKELAKQNSIDLGLKGQSTAPSPAPRVATRPPVQVPVEPDSRVSPEDAKKYFAEIVANLAASKNKPPGPRRD